MEQLSLFSGESYLPPPTSSSTFSTSTQPTSPQSSRKFDTGSVRDDDSNKPLVNHLHPYTRLRFGYLLRIGATKYGKGNWMLGQPDETAIESLHRHLAKYELGDRSEDHLSAMIFNIQLILLNEMKSGVEVDEYFKKDLEGIK